MSIVKEFKDFAMKGNVVDLAVGVIVGASFGKIVSSLVADVFMPPLALITGGIDFTKQQIALKTAENGEVLVALKWGNFAQNVFDFLIVAFCIFCVVKALNSFKKKQESAPVEPTKQEVLLTEIRDLLKKNNS